MQLYDTVNRAHCVNHHQKFTEPTENQEISQSVYLLNYVMEVKSKPPLQVKLDLPMMIFTDMKKRVFQHIECY